MNTDYSVKRVASDLQEEVWSFCYVDNNQLVLQEYELLERASKRHKFKVTKSHRSRNERDSDFKTDEVPLPDDVIAEVLDLFVKGLRVVRSYERQ